MEDDKSQTSSEGHDQAVKLSLKLAVLWNRGLKGQGTKREGKWGLMVLEWKRNDSTCIFSDDFGITVDVICVITLLCFTIPTFYQTKIYLKRRWSSLSQNSRTEGFSQRTIKGEGTPFNTVRYKKAVLNALWVQFGITGLSSSIVLAAYFINGSRAPFFYFPWSPY